MSGTQSYKSTHTHNSATTSSSRNRKSKKSKYDKKENYDAVTYGLHLQPWYHGLRSRNDITPLLKRPGDFLVRATADDDRINVILSFCVNSQTKILSTDTDAPPNEDKQQNNKVFHATLFYDKEVGTWELSALVRKRASRKDKRDSSVKTKFPTVSHLVTYYTNHAIVSDVKLKNGISRPPWLFLSMYLRFEHSEFLGKGNFAQVVKAKLKVSNHRGKTVAIKMLLDTSKNENMTKQQRNAEIDSMMREAKLMSRYKHTNLIDFYGVACDRPPIMIVMEYCPGGSLEGHLKKELENIPANERIVYCFESARGLRYLHYHKCIHRDLACRNCLISATGRIKISDFGLSKMLDQKHIDSEEENLSNVPLRWMAPETISRTPQYSTKSDVWSYGVMVYEIFNLGVKPWADTEDFKMISKAIRKGNMPPPPEGTPEPMQQILSLCWIVEKDKRPEMIDISRKLTEIQSSGPQYAPPEPADFTVNRRNHVNRQKDKESMANQIGEYSLRSAPSKNNEENPDED